MPEFSNSEDKIPYPLPPTTVAPTTTKMTEEPNVLKVPLFVCMQYQHPTLTITKAKKLLEKKKTQPTLSVVVQVIF
jgi:hypothetical protein